VWLLFAVAWWLPARGAEVNVWPLLVGEQDPATGRLNPAQAVGPLFFRRVDDDGLLTQGFRPFFLTTKKGDKETAYLLYPFLTWRNQGEGYSTLSFLQLVNDRRESPPGLRGPVHGFDVWPFWFSRETGNPATSYHALFPVAGTIIGRFGDDRLTWFAFPLFLQTEKAGRRITSALWPIVRVIDGAGHHGFELWPLFGERGRAGDYRERFWLWPLFYRHEANLSAAEPDVKIGALPFYAAEHGPGYRDVTFVWPFFGAMHRTLPARYDETRYFWPFLVQGRGEDRLVNRWGPIYTHSVIMGYDKTWLLWPLYRHAEWQEGGLAQRQDRLFYFVYWSLQQRDPRRPGAAPAYKTHLWPLFSAWNNGAGRSQFQLFSPLEVFFPQNDVIRQLYSPLFAVYRWEQLAPGDSHGSVLWGLLSWHRTPGGREYHLGPLLSTESAPDRARVALGQGLLSWRRDSRTGRWRFLMFDFTSSPVQTARAASPP
ncbi:MAG: hypothetical protein ACHQ5A_04000, partial [Opitutales bacterium]